MVVLSLKHLASPTMFSSILIHAYRYIDDHHLCCHFENLEECISLEPQPSLFKCGSLMQISVLRVSLWVLGISALIGNLVVVVIRINEGVRKSGSPTRGKQKLLIGNLAVADFFMGVYMVILASVDFYYGDQYFIFSDVWRSSRLCKLESFLTLLSSEASVLFVTLMTLDRFLCIVFPLSSKQLTPKSTKMVALLIWVMAFMLGFIPTYYASADSDLYDLSDVCIGLPLITRPTSYIIESRSIDDTDGLHSVRSFNLPVPEEFKPAWYLSIAIFLGLNSVCFLFILVCHIVMFVKVKMMNSHVKDDDDDLKIAIRMAVIVGTDFLCWVPVIIMGILSQTGSVVIPLQMYTWSVVFILPINSSVNPYLYTIASRITDYKKTFEKKVTVPEPDVSLVEFDRSEAVKSQNEEDKPLEPL